ncbi:hypothetical protein GXW82_05835 [Streptacidiphilus sp. 4-A2]|nr:hypothetical protein [Streptacidiphilus sp. 4-A2]
MTNSEPLGLPSRLLAHPEFVAACARRDIGAVFRLAKLHAGFFPARIGRLTGLTTSRVSEHMSTQRVMSNMQVIERVSDGLRIPGHLLGLARRTWEVDQASEDVPDRALCPETWEVLDTLTRSTVSSEVLLHLEAAVMGVATGYPSSAPEQLLPTMNRQLSKIHQLLDHPQAISARRRCVELLTVLSGLMGLAHMDTDDFMQSSALFQMGQAAAAEADNVGLTAWLLTMQSITLSVTSDTGEPVELLEYADVLAAAAPQRRRAWISANLARSHAANGNRAAALMALDRSAAHLDCAGEFSGLDFFTGARLDGIAGTTHALLGEHDTAARLLDAALEGRDAADTKGRAILTFDLAECRIRQGEIEEGCRLAHAALDLAAGNTVQPARIRVTALERTLTPWRQAAPVAFLAERVRESQGLIDT